MWNMVTLRCSCGATARAKATATGAELALADPSLARLLGDFLRVHGTMEHTVSVEANVFPAPMSYKGRRRSRPVK